MTPPQQQREHRIRVLIACAGLGIARRGFERVARDMFEMLRNREELEVWLVKGRGAGGEHERRAWTIRRAAPLARALGLRLGRDPGWHEQRLFSITIQPILARVRPDVVVLSEWTVARALAITRKLTRQRFSVLLSNGVGRAPPFPPGVDHVQQVTPSAVAAAAPAVRAGAAPAQTLLPHALRIRARFDPPTREEQQSLRKALDLPTDRPIMLSVGALNRTKRVDYLIREVASLSDRPFLALLGDFDPETPELLGLAHRLLGSDGFVARSVPEPEVAEHYRAADCFALASMKEGFGLALADGLAHGLPVIAHDFPQARFVLGEHGFLADLSAPGTLAGVFSALGPKDSIWARGGERHDSAYRRFSWDVLTPAYLQMLQEVAGASRAP